MAAGDNVMPMELGFCWLDANGYGHQNTRWLHYELVKATALQGDEGHSDDKYNNDN